MLIFGCMYKSRVIAKLPKKDRFPRQSRGLFDCFEYPFTCLSVCCGLPMVVAKPYRNEYACSFEMSACFYSLLLLPTFICVAIVGSATWALFTWVITVLIIECNSQTLRERRLRTEDHNLLTIVLSMLCCYPCILGRESLEEDDALGVELGCCFKLTEKSEVSADMVSPHATCTQKPAAPEGAGGLAEKTQASADSVSPHAACTQKPGAPELSWTEKAQALSADVVSPHAPVDDEQEVKAWGTCDVAKLFMPTLGVALFVWFMSWPQSVTRVGVPLVPAAAIVLTLLLVAMSALSCSPMPLPIKIEIMASTADFASDVYWVLRTKFFSPVVLIVAALLTFGQSAAFIAYRYGGHIVRGAWESPACFLPVGTDLCWQIATTPWNRLQNHGIHQVVSEARDSPEMAFVNLLASVALAVVMPLGWMIAVAGAFLLLALSVLTILLSILFWYTLGTALHGARLLAVVHVHGWYERKIDGKGEATSGEVQYAELIDQDDPAFQLYFEDWNRSILMELVGETAPNLVVNIMNFFMLSEKNFGLSNWVQLAMSLYMIFRVGYKYGYWILFLGKSLKEIRPKLPETTTDQLLAAGGPGSAVASLAKDAVGVAGAP